MTDADRFEAFVRKYQDMVFGTAVRLLGDPTEAEDVSQTVFLKAFERFQALDAQPAAAGWLKTVTTNACLNHLSRVRSRWRFFSELGRTDLGGESAAYEDGLVCQWQPKTAHLWQPKTAHSWGGRLGRSGHSPGDARRACWAGRRERSDRSPAQHAPRSCGAGGHVATPSRCSSDAVLSQC